MKKYLIKPNLYHLYHLQFICEDLVRAIHNLNLQNGTDWKEATSNPEKFFEFDRCRFVLDGYLRALQMKFTIDKSTESITIYDFKDNILYKFTENSPIIEEIDSTANELSLKGW